MTQFGHRTVVHGQGIVALAAALAIGGPAPGDVLHVRQGATPGGDGASWPTAFRELRDVLPVAGPGDEIWVAAGIYAPVPPGGPRSVSFVVPDGVSVLGGFVGNESSADERDWTVHATVLTGDVDGDDDGTPASRDDNALHVVRNAPSGGIVLDGLVIRGGNSFVEKGRGGGVLLEGGSHAIRNCRVSGNAAGFGGGLAAIGLDFPLGDVEIRNCRIEDNLAQVGQGGLWVVTADDLVIVDTTIVGNDGSLYAGGGTLSFCATATLERCRIIGNRSSFIAGGLGLLGPVTMLNCLFDGNESPRGAGVHVGPLTPVEILNCTFRGNTGGGAINTESASNSVPPIVRNSIFRANTPLPIMADAEDVGDAMVETSNVEGGWTGTGGGNIDADPHFVQPGSGDLRLSFGSPCLDAGDTDAVPPDVTTDLAGSPRVQGAGVDMGAYEGAFPPGAPVATAEDLDPGESADLVPEGGALDPSSAPAVFVYNLGGGADGVVTVTQLAATMHPLAPGFTVVGPELAVASTLPDGGAFYRVYVPIDAAALGAAAPLDAEIHRYLPATDDRALAILANTVPSPGHPGVEGDRIVVVDGADPGVTFDLGDRGVYWSTATETGYAWSNTDVPGDFTIGHPACATDCTLPADGNVGMLDLVQLLAAWGGPANACDVVDDGVIDGADLAALLADWGGCVEP